jgi:hypothetical protein
MSVRGLKIQGLGSRQLKLVWLDEHDHTVAERYADLNAILGEGGDSLFALLERPDQGLDPVPLAVDALLRDRLLGPEWIRGVFRRRNLILPALDDAIATAEIGDAEDADGATRGASDDGITDGFRKGASDE